MDPPFAGIVETTLDALILFENSRRGHLPRITRRLAEKERGMIKSGAVFVGRVPSSCPFWPAAERGAVSLADLRRGRIWHQEVDGWADMVALEE
jgi:hypothetical protein